MSPSPVRITQRASRRGTVEATASRIAWSRAPLWSVVEIVRRATPAAGSSTRSRPPASLSSVPLPEDNERVALGHRLALRDDDLLDDPGVLGLDRHLHLHRLEDHDRVALLDAVAHLHLDLPHGARDVGLDVGQ